VLSADEYFYCGFSNLDGSGQDYARWAKGTDFNFNDSKNRWEWVSEYTFQYIYPDGRYEQISRGDLFDNQRGYCNAKMEAIYNQKMAEIKEKYGR
tara:strand:+ start:1591 stop:1875 length:285 start_codon:yes stop_codon:yes gene_type:complete